MYQIEFQGIEWSTTNIDYRLINCIVTCSFPIVVIWQLIVFSYSCPFPFLAAKMSDHKINIVEISDNDKVFMEINLSVDNNLVHMDSDDELFTNYLICKGFKL